MNIECRFRGLARWKSCPPRRPSTSPTRSSWRSWASRRAALQHRPSPPQLPVEDHVSDTDAIPEFKARSADGQEVGITNLSAFSSGPGVKSMAEVLAIVIVAVVMVGGAEILLHVFN